jgi:hypothetical protein
MASTYTNRLGLEKQTDGENPNSWGAILNTNVIDLIDDAIAGYDIVSVSSTGITLSDNNGATDQSRNAALEFAGTLTANVTITIPSEEKTYFIRENTTGSFAVQMKTAAGSALTLTQQSNVFVACDGTDIYSVESPTSVSAFTVNDLTANVLTATSITTSILAATNVSTSIMNATDVSTTTLAATSISTSVLDASSITVTGNVSAAEYYGDGSNLTGLSNTFPRGHLSGLTLSNGTDADHDIDIAVGEAKDSGNTTDLSLSAIMTKQIDATWASGTNAGGMASGVTLSADTWYHVYLVELDAGGTDAGFDTSTTAANLVATSGIASAYRRIGSILTDSSSNILGFTQFEDEFIFDTQIVNVNGTGLGTSRVLQTVSAPLGFETRAILGLIGVVAGSNASVTITLTHPNVTDAVSSNNIANNAGENSSGANGTWAAGTHIVRTNTSSQVAFRQSFNSTVYINTNGYYDPRGRG